MAAVVAALALAAWPAAAQPGAGYDPKAATAYIVRSEGEWAASVATGKTKAVERILADDFQGVDPEGKTYAKADMVADTRNGPKIFVSNRINAVKVRFFGDAAVAQGSESWIKRSGVRGRFVWTDTWVRRGGEWRIVAAEDLIAPDAAP